MSIRLHDDDASFICKAPLTFEIKHDKSDLEIPHVSKHLMLIQKHTAGIMILSFSVCICLK